MQQAQEDVEEFSVAVQIRMIALDLRWLDILNLHYLFSKVPILQVWAIWELPAK